MPIVSPPIAPEETRAARDLHLGDVILRDPDTGVPVRWVLNSDGTTHKSGTRIWFLVGTDPQDRYSSPRYISFGIDEQLSSRKATR